MADNAAAVEDDLSLPRAAVNKMIKEMIPMIRVSNDARELVLNCCTEFIHLIASEANEICNKQTKKTISPEHVIQALESLGFHGYVKDVEGVYQQFKKQAQTRKKNNKLKNQGVSEEELLRQQQELIARARAEQAQEEWIQLQQLSTGQQMSGAQSSTLTGVQPPSAGLHQSSLVGVHSSHVSEVQPTSLAGDQPLGTQSHPTPVEGVHPSHMSGIQSTSLTGGHQTPLTGIQSTAYSEALQYPPVTISAVKAAMMLGMQATSTISRVQPDTISVMQSTGMSGMQPTTFSEMRPSAISRMEPVKISEVKPTSISGEPSHASCEMQPDTFSGEQPIQILSGQPITHTGIQTKAHSEVQSTLISNIEPSIVSEMQSDVIPDIQPATTSKVQPDVIPRIQPTFFSGVQPTAVSEVLPTAVSEVHHTPQIEAQPKEVTANQSNPLPIAMCSLAESQPLNGNLNVTSPNVSQFINSGPNSSINSVTMPSDALEKSYKSNNVDLSSLEKETLNNLSSNQQNGNLRNESPMAVDISDGNNLENT